MTARVVESESVESHVFSWSRSRFFLNCWSRSRVFKNAGVGVGSRFFKTAGVGVGNRFFNTAGVGVRSRNPKKSSDSTTLHNT